MNSLASSIAGCWVVVEGTAGAGKSTAIRWLQLTGRAVTFAEIDHHAANLGKGGTFSWYLRQERDRRALISCALESNHLVVQDRSCFSTLAHAFAMASTSRQMASYRLKRNAVLTFLDSERHQPSLILRMKVDQRVSLARRFAWSRDKRYAEWFNPRFLTAYEEFYDLELPSITHTRIAILDTTALTSIETSMAVGELLKEIVPSPCAEATRADSTNL